VGEYPVTDKKVKIGVNALVSVNASFAVMSGKVMNKLCSSIGKGHHPLLFGN
tara:strand:+ start:2348 stop:2503 length:156 start_codon:yes stop_codon:yes gene_type:complete